MKHEALIIIPARGGSKGILRKNMALIGGKPLVKFAFDAAKEANLPGRICLSTDDAEIREFGLREGAEAPFIRPAELARDESSTVSVIQHALNWYSLHENFEPEFIVLLQPTCPFRTAQNIRESYQLMLENRSTSLISVNIVHEHPCEYIALARDGFSYIMEPPTKPGRQNFPRVFFINGAIYITKTDFLKKTNMLFDTGSQAYIMDRSESLDIDSPEDLDFANWYYDKKAQAKE